MIWGNIWISGNREDKLAILESFKTANVWLPSGQNSRDLSLSWLVSFSPDLLPPEPRNIYLSQTSPLPFSPKLTSLSLSLSLSLYSFSLWAKLRPFWDQASLMNGRQHALARAAHTLATRGDPAGR